MIEYSKLQEIQKNALVEPSVLQSTYLEIKKDFINISSHLPKPSEKVAYYLAGQPGSGKTELREKVIGKFPEFRPVVINTDSLRDYHPMYEYFQADKKLHQYAPFLVDPDAGKWANMLLKDVVNEGRNIVMDSTMGGNPDHFITGINALKTAGYRIEIHVYAVPKEISFLGTEIRYLKLVEKNGHGRFVRKELHDKSYDALPVNLDKIINASGIKDISVYGRVIGNEKNIPRLKAVPTPVASTNSGDVGKILTNLEKYRTLDLSVTQKQYYTNILLQTKDLAIKHGLDAHAFEERHGTLISKVNEKSKEKTKGLSF